jgi:tyrosyl-tRNA synthetase
MSECKIEQATAVADIIANAKLAASKNEAKRLIAGGGVTLDGRRVEDFAEQVQPGSRMVLQVGKRRFLKLT